MIEEAVFDEIEFDTHAEGAGPAEIRVKINGVDLVDLIGSFEIAQGFDPAGGYGGLIPAYYRFGPMTDHFLGAAESNEVPVLGCDCGEWGCWPLIAHIHSDRELVRWSRFTQPHRPSRDYAAFGPMTFRRESYDIALRRMEEQLLRTK